MSIYFKQLKTLMCMFFVFTVLSVPAFALFWSGKSHNRSLSGEATSLVFNEVILALSLGNLGEKALFINELDLKKSSQVVEMFCETGVIGGINKHGIALVERFDNEVAYFEDTYCGTDLSAYNKQQIEDECFDKQFCSIKFKIDRAPLIQKCREEYKGTRKTLDFNEYAFFLEFECNIENIRLEGFGEISRTQLANIVMMCDALICIWFVCHTALQSCWIRREA